uniref:Uncharacterized protein n=1 Tax=Oryza sativa subsp. japonica TaxID=39947 RepID=Q9FWN0_ORYSJ|nr:hypothetical protein [Oryza sativa Japonica Group]
MAASISPVVISIGRPCSPGVPPGDPRCRGGCGGDGAAAESVVVLLDREERGKGIEMKRRRRERGGRREG